MEWWELLLVGLVGGAAGLINTVVGSGTLITFPTLLALGMPPVLANVSNCIGLAPGSFAGALAGRDELVGQRSRVLRYGIPSLLGAVAGALLLLVTSEDAFDAIAPWLVLAAVGLFAAQPLLGTLAADPSLRAATQRDSDGPMTTSRQPSPMRTGTMALKADDGRLSSSSAPATAPSRDGIP